MAERCRRCSLLEASVRWRGQVVWGGAVVGRRLVRLLPGGATTAPARGARRRGVDAGRPEGVEAGSRRHPRRQATESAAARRPVEAAPAAAAAEHGVVWADERPATRAATEPAVVRPAERAARATPAAQASGQEVPIKVAGASSERARRRARGWRPGALVISKGWPGLGSQTGLLRVRPLSHGVQRRGPLLQLLLLWGRCSGHEDGGLCCGTSGCAASSATTAAQGTSLGKRQVREQRSDELRVDARTERGTRRGVEEGREKGCHARMGARRRLLGGECSAVDSSTARVRASK